MHAVLKLSLIGLIALGPVAGAAAQTPALSRTEAADAREQPDYLIGAGDLLQIFVWKNPELSVDVPVRPDGKITTPLVPDVQAQGRSPTELAAKIREALAAYVQDPVVTVLVKTVAAPTNAASIRVIGAAATPKTVPYHAGLTLLDVLIEVGGLNIYASGNRAVLLRNDNGVYRSQPLRLNDLVKSGKLDANLSLQPGDIIRIPERWF
jgi:polysaccharide export outer membrane protein